MLYGGSHDGGDGGALIRTDIEKDDLRLAAERACLFHVGNWSRMVSQLTYSQSALSALADDYFAKDINLIACAHKIIILIGSGLF
jgi:hypothetical protein